MAALRRVLYADFLRPGGPDNQRYEEVPDAAALLKAVEDALADYNAQVLVEACTARGPFTDSVLILLSLLQSKSRLDLVIFQYAAEHICRISRIIKQPYGNALLVSLLLVHASMRYGIWPQGAPCTQGAPCRQRCAWKQQAAAITPC